MEPYAKYEIDLDVLMWGDTNRPIISLVTLIGEMGEDWIPYTLYFLNLSWWRWN